MEVERQVASHYGRHGLKRAVRAALAASGTDLGRLAPGSLAALDEFHLGGAAATAALAQALALPPGTRLLDIGCGLGGPARHFAAAHGCVVTAIDLTADYLALATELTRASGLEDRVAFCRAGALALPFAEGAFARVTLIHVGMNIADKRALLAGIRRVLAPGGRLGLYDIMRLKEGALSFPLPWARTAEISFVAPADDYRALLAGAGFAIERESDWSARALAVAREMRARAAKDGPPALGLHLLMGEEAGQRLGNLLGAVEQGTLAPVMMVARRAE